MSDGLFDWIEKHQLLVRMVTTIFLLIIIIPFYRFGADAKQYNTCSKKGFTLLTNGDCINQSAIGSCMNTCFDCDTTAFNYVHYTKHTDYKNNYSFYGIINRFDNELFNESVRYPYEPR